MNVVENLYHRYSSLQLQPDAPADRSGSFPSPSSWQIRVLPGARAPQLPASGPPMSCPAPGSPKLQSSRRLLLQLPVQPVGPAFELPGAGWPPAAFLAAAAPVAAAASQPTRLPLPQSHLLPVRPVLQSLNPTTSSRSHQSVALTTGELPAAGRPRAAG
eukprot:CAMPEP_0194710584 /NCGR_PEP_ID=MMETSP0296-20130528/3153_1 /TAXON_ID=39354 /ORGANISM="Heterosigma akashiwo, Strain CCMP2393" /LENGTH=158 /DNA_ID=CAMNT_0039608371 /DNA_START=436 /DNA_END=913 /DNA_ORIENTATION=-